MKQISTRIFGKTWIIALLSLIGAPVFSQQMDLPVTFETSGVNYGVIGFGGADSSVIVVDPTNASNTVVRVYKSITAELWAGTTVTDAAGSGLANPISFAPGATSMTVKVYSPDAGIPVRLKVEDHTNPTISVETEATTTVANQWETLTFNFINQAPGTAAINLANNYDKASIFFNFGTTGAVAGAKTYWFDDLEFVPGGGTGLAQMNLPVTFEGSTINYSLIGFGGAEVSTIEVDPTNASNTVAKVVKSNTAQLWAGTTITDSLNSGFASAIPLTPSSTQMTLKVWSPDAGIPVRLKVEDYTNPTISVETEALTTVANTWETLTFDFINQAPGTAVINYANNYNKASVFFNFGTTGAIAGTKTYYFDDLQMFSVQPVGLNVTIEICGATTPNTVRMTGPFWGWDPNGGPLATNNGNGTWTVNLNPIPTTNMEYLFVVDGVQENLVGDMQNGGTCAPITDYSNYANRIWNVGEPDVTGIAFDRCVSCSIEDLVITTEICDVNAPTQVNLTGPLWSWSLAFGPQAVDNGNGTWTFTISPAPTDTLEYLLVKDGVMENLIQAMVDGGTCAPLTDYATYANRQWVNGTGSVSNTYGYCVACSTQSLNEAYDNRISVYPNPTSSKLTVSRENNMDKIVVYSIVGEAVLEIEVNAASVEIDIENLASGVYQLVATGANSISRTQIVKK